MDKQFVRWSDDLSVGIEEIDEQHKILVAVINRLFDETIVNKADTRVLYGIINELVEYTIIHFAVEESLFRIFEYPDTENHLRHHNDLKEQVLAMQERVRIGEIKVDSDLLVFLKKWLQNHIANGDRQYGTYLMHQGLKGSFQNGDWIFFYMTLKQAADQNQIRLKFITIISAFYSEVLKTRYSTCYLHVLDNAVFAIDWLLRKSPEFINIHEGTG